MASLAEVLRGAVSPEQLNALGAVLNRTDYDGGFETVTSGAISLTKRTTKLSIDGTKAFTLADGLYAGQIKFLFCSVATNTPAGTVTPANFDVGASLGFNATNDAAILEWDGTNWIAVSLTSVTIS